MTAFEIMRITDIIMHLAYAAILLHHTARHPSEQITERMIRTLAVMCSLFLACTVWQYGRTELFVLVHNIWQLSVVGSAYYALRKP